ncbi:hypothetical protein [Streptomyces sp. NPDC056291]|uniref:hypothetical protein n=1 Tax=Streptomyces sp. NPDC056291 TaxID=3345772 RepID=UPI0035E22B1C
MAVNQCVQKDNMSELFDKLTPLIADGVLVFPRAVVDDLTTFARDEPVAFWSQGVTPMLRAFSPQIEHNIWFTRKVQVELGYEEGLANVDGSEPSLVDVMSLARRCERDGTPFYIVSDDVSENPLRPSAAELCAHFSWERVSMAGYLDLHAGLSHLLS